MLFFKRDRPKLQSVKSAPTEGFSGWSKCGGCNELIHDNELNDHLGCCPKCDYHHRVSVKERIAMLADANSFVETNAKLTSLDPLDFTDSTSYKERLTKARANNSSQEAIVTGQCQVDKIPIVLSIMDFSFMGGSMGSVVGEKFTRAVELAIKEKAPLISFTCSGGARMQEGIFSLLQMAKTSCALSRMSEEKIPYISVLTNPTTGGVTASFASLGDIIIAEPGALICFAGPRVIEQVIGHKLPKGAQKPQFLKEHGMIDKIIPRNKLKQSIGLLVRLLQNSSSNF